jgi:hypothetical protein
MFERDVLTSPMNLDINGLSTGDTFFKKREQLRTQQVKVRKTAGLF